MDKTPLWVVSESVYPFRETGACVKPPYNFIVQATVSVICSSLCLTCFDVTLSFMSVHFMQGVTLFFIFVCLFFFLEESCIKALVHIHITARLL